MKRWKKVGIAAGCVVLVLVVGIQFVPVERTNPPVTEEIQAPDDVKALLRRSCYDCHSHETKWPWYGYVAPVSWLLARDVREGREHINFSKWDEVPEMGRDYIKTMILEAVSAERMPLPKYLTMHPEARIGPEDLQVLKRWAGETPQADEAADQPDLHEGHEH